MTDRNGAQPADSKVCQFGYIVFASRRKDLVKLEGRIFAPNQKSAEDTVMLVMQRDSRIQQAFLVNPETGETLWGAFPGTLRQELEKAGFGPDFIRGI